MRQGALEQGGQHAGEVEIESSRTPAADFLGLTDAGSYWDFAFLNSTRLCAFVLALFVFDAI